jgi:aryl-alcohol dehydrogenase-like predicted oxidoreductase
MHNRTLGRSGIEVSPLGMGCWAIGGVWKFLNGQGGWGEVDDQESIRAVQRALDDGINFFDTAANYGTGHSERILGQALAGRRDKAAVATKFGFQVNEEDKQVTYHENAEAVIRSVRAECEASLRRLGMDYIDFYQLHVWDYPLEPVPALLDELEALVKEGKIRTYGWSTDSVEGARLFAEGEHCVGIQHDLNFANDAPEMLALCEELNLASVNRTPLGRSALTGKYTTENNFGTNDVRRGEWHRFSADISKLDAVRDILTSEGRTPAQGALAWIWARSEQTLPIPGIRTVAQAAENAAAMQYGPLKPEQMAEIEEVLGRAVSTR